MAKNTNVSGRERGSKEIDGQILGWSEADSKLLVKNAIAAAKKAGVAMKYEYWQPR